MIVIAMARNVEGPRRPAGLRRAHVGAPAAQSRLVAWPFTRRMTHVANYDRITI
jgi:hypothetical protein